jgi:PAS domain S-box-containing protein
LRTTYDQSPIGMLQLDRELRYVRINDALAAMNGLPTADHIGKSIHEVVPDLAARLEPEFRKALEGQPVLNAEVVGETPAAPGVTHTWLLSWYPMRGSDDAVVGINVVAQDITERKRAETAIRENQRQLRLLVDELNHRVKNTLAIVQSIATQTLRRTATDEIAQTFNGRLFALSRAHDQLTRTNWDTADLEDLIKQVSMPHRDSPDRIIIAGPNVRLVPNSAMTFSLALHELCTNAVKYGALSGAQGRVDIRWSVDSDSKRLLWHWQESGGPTVSPPPRRGFGSRMIEKGLAREFSGQVNLKFDAGGLSCTIDAPLPEEGAGSFAAGFGKAVIDLDTN